MVFLIRFTRKKKDLYLLLIGEYEEINPQRYCAKNVAKFLGVTRQYVSKVINKDLIKNRYITCDNPHARTKFYSSTCKKPSFLVNQNSQKSVNHFSPSNPANFTGSLQGGVFSTSISQWSCPIENLSKVRGLDQWKSYNMCNGVVKYYKDYLFSEPINTFLKFQITIGKNKATMNLVYPRMEFDNKEDFRNFERDIGDYVKQAMHFIAQKYNIGMDVTKIYIPRKNGVDYETPVRDADQKMIQAYIPMESKYMEDGIEKKIMYNGSGGIVKCEGSTPEIPIQYLSLPFIFKEVMKVAEKIVKSTEEIMKLKELLIVGRELDKNFERENRERGVI